MALTEGVTDGNPRINSVSTKPHQQIIASSCGAIITSVFMTPLDVVKVRLQSQNKPFVKGQCSLYCDAIYEELCECINGKGTLRPKPRVRQMVFTGTIDAFSKIIKYEGPASLWSGLPATILMSVPATMVYFTAYDQLKYCMGYHDNPGSSLKIPVVAGLTARVGTVFVVSPFELIRTKMQSQKHTYQDVYKAVRTSIKSEGLGSLWKGVGPTLVRDVPFSAMYWFLYEYFKSLFCRDEPTFEPTFLQSFASGALAGTIAGSITLPFDVIKTHRQIELGQMKRGDHPSRTTDLLHRLYKQKGFRGLFSGIVPRIVKVAPACAIMISTYEYAKLFFRKRNEEAAIVTLKH